MPTTVVNKVLGAGKIYFDPDGGGERYIAETPGFSISIATTKVTSDSSDEPLAETDLEVFTKVARTAKIVTNDINGDNLAIFFVAAKGGVTQSSGAVTGEHHLAVKQGRWIQLGPTDGSNPTGVRDLSAVTIKDTASPPSTYSSTTDYQLDAEMGRIFIIVGGGIDDDSEIVAGYTKAAGSREQVIANSLEPVEGKLRFIANNTAGDNRDVFGARVRLSPNGDFAAKDRANVQALSFDAEFKKPEDGSAALYIDSRPV